MEWNRRCGLSHAGFDYKLSSISVDDAGFGYSMPCEVKVLGGFPQFTNQEYTQLPGYALDITDPNSTGSDYNFTEAKIVVSKIDENGSILELNVTDGGRGYVPYWKIDRTPPGDSVIWPEPPDNHPHGGKELFQFGYPLVLVTGGGGHGAVFYPVIDETNGSIIDTVAATDVYGVEELRGRGYFNFEDGNYPKIAHSNISSDAEKNATLKVRLGGYLKEIPPCTSCQNGNHAPVYGKYNHLEPWVEIWDRGRTETEIDEKGLRAHGAPKVVNGKIEKVVVTKSGGGYVDPVAYVRDVSPKNGFYWDKESGKYRRKWVCTFMRLNKQGIEEMCGHIHWDHLPPEECPGETDAELPYADENGTLIYATGDQIELWQKRHENESNRHLLYCVHDENSTDRKSHLNANFVSRKCWGTKINYVLDKNGSYYRNPRSEWAPLDAKLRVVTEKGKIREIIVDNPGANYFATQIMVQGTGSEVDAIPVFDEFGINTEVIFNDPRLKNTEFDIIDRPHGAGQGFRERPWSWDSSVGESYTTPEGSQMETGSYEPKFSYADKVKVWAHHSEVAHSIQTMVYPYSYFSPTFEPVWRWNFGDPVLADNLGDRVLEVEVLDEGNFSNAEAKTQQFEIDFNATFLDFDRDGKTDFRAAKVAAHYNNYLTSFYLDNNATFIDNENGPEIERGLFLEDPTVYILDGSMLRSVDVANNVPLASSPEAYTKTDYTEDNRSEFIRLNEFKEDWQGLINLFSMAYSNMIPSKKDHMWTYLWMIIYRINFTMGLGK